MDISGRDLAKKFQELFPGDTTFKVSAQLLNETCENSIVQNFLKWFCDHVGPHNVLQKHEREFIKNLKKNEQYLTGSELDDALIEATKDCPELLELIDLNKRSDEHIAKAYEAEKDAYDADVNDLATLEDSLAKLIEIESKLDEELEKEENELQKFEIGENKSYADCASLINEFDFAHREIYEDLQYVVKVYADAAEKKGPTIAWTQVPLDIFIKQTENYYNCLYFHVNRKLKNSQNYEPSNLPSHELIQSMLSELGEKIELEGFKGLAARAHEIYSNIETQIPQNESQMRLEIAELMSKRDILTEDIAMLEAQLQESVNQYGRLSVTKILLDDGYARLNHKKKRLSNIENLLHLARDKGHAHADFLAILMQIQLQKLNEIIEFVRDARYYLSTEYTRSSKRCDIMQEVQDKYDTIISSSPCKKNIYNKLFSLLINEHENNDGNDDDNFVNAVKQYDELLNENKIMKNEIENIDLDTKINYLRQTENDVMRVFNHEISDGPTKSFKLMPYKILALSEQVTQSVHDAQTIVTESRNKLKDIMKKTTNSNWDREKILIWQKYLCDPDKLKQRYDEAKQIVDRSHFVGCELNKK
ncbi:hypothetical protein HCN44_009458 [Aphidius gifuensis]|uniref:HAUS augmin-like complex subunit 3 N-terminal domain-containing protein n=1 Tax=Aphidius gifuensis TaxID=684658 RepID=A0A835CYX5_APHGI|nr:hypothetical protein HCN44_009458 [Aphidius gifuensis]